MTARPLVGRLKKALAHLNLKSSSPLQHWAPCGFWQNKACSCPCADVVDVLREAIAALETPAAISEAGNSAQSAAREIKMDECLRNRWSTSGITFEKEVTRIAAIIAAHAEREHASQLVAQDAEIARLRKEIAVTNALLGDRQRVLDAIPPCEDHGPCIPHALSWIEAAKAHEAQLTAARQSLAALEEEIHEHARYEALTPAGYVGLHAWAERLTAIRAALGAP